MRGSKLGAARSDLTWDAQVNGRAEEPLLEDLLERVSIPDESLQLKSQELEKLCSGDEWKVFFARWLACSLRQSLVASAR